MERNGGSRLLQMQARFQQKQLQEREMKIASLYEAQQARALDRVRHSPTIALASPPEPHQPGKVRQMFEERRTKAGIDKSYPLQPISTNKQPPRKPMTNGKVTSSGATTTMANGHRVTTSSRVTTNTVERKTRTTAGNVTSTVRKTQHKTHNVVNGSGDLNHNHETDFNANKHAHPYTNGETDEDRPDYRLEDETFPVALEPAATPRSPEPAPARSEPLRPPRRSPATKTAPKYSPPVAPPRRVTSENAVSEGRVARGAMQRTQAPTTSGRSSVAGAGGAGRAGAASRRAAPAGSADGVPCAVCGRRFAADRLEKHQEICRRTQNKKRKPFDALKHRLQGTEAEQFIGKLRKPASNNQSNTKVGKPLPNSNWRKKHEEFITAIRAAKQVQQHLAAGGKLSDLPPPPPSENPDYIQCPHCNRRFNQAAAERHIPKCADFQYNKPKPNTTKKR